MKVRIVTGNKGGIGKSFVTLLLADYLVRNNLDFLVGDAEASSGQATTWNVMRHNIDETQIRAWSLCDSAGFEKMADELQVNAQKDMSVVVDTGASMLHSLNQNLDFLEAINQDLKLDIGIVFIAGPLPDSVVSTRDFLRTQKQLEKPLKTTFLLMSPDGKEQQEYAVMQDEKVQNAIEKQGANLAFLGTVRQDFFDEIMMKFQIPYKTLANNDVGYSFRKRLDMWVKMTVDPIAAKIWE